jgi:hypothetical protein
MTKTVANAYGGRWNEPRRVPTPTPAEWAAQALRDVVWRAEVVPADQPHNPFLVGLVLSLARTYLAESSARPSSPQQLADAQLEALRSVFHKIPNAQYYWPEALHRLAQQPSRRTGIEAGKAITIAAFDTTRVSDSLAKQASTWLEGQSSQWISAVCGESREQQFAYALRETLVIEKLAPHRAMPKNDA